MPSSASCPRLISLSNKPFSWNAALLFLSGNQYPLNLSWFFTPFMLSSLIQNTNHLPVKHLTHWFKKPWNFIYTSSILRNSLFYLHLLNVNTLVQSSYILPVKIHFLPKRSYTKLIVIFYILYELLILTKATQFVIYLWIEANLDYFSIIGSSNVWTEIYIWVLNCLKASTNIFDD